MSGKNQPDFIPIVVWDKLAEICGNNLAKGWRVLVEGQLQIYSHETNAAERRRAAEVVANSVKFMDRPQEEKDSWGRSFFVTNLLYY